jgi:hypothetical protein
LRHALHRAGNANFRPDVSRLIGCSWSEYAQHLGELQDKQIDHIIPVCYYNMFDIDDLSRAFNWRNTQLLSTNDNLAKGGKLPSADELRALRCIWPKCWCDTELPDTRKHILV